MAVKKVVYLISKNLLLFESNSKKCYLLSLKLTRLNYNSIKMTKIICYRMKQEFSIGLQFFKSKNIHQDEVFEN